ncbi:MAG TPA: polysaccharide deacetylase family protein [Cytophagaceae bacterium]|jgi:peptidoglycan/xylan/chitin deacetylase (PgdA/CDA1 family)|nr:polysaccharide deacetylase family protein [Cytophagaceae bacterium]
MNKNNFTFRIIPFFVALFLLVTTATFSQDKKTKPLPIITSSEIWIDRFDNPTGKALTGGNWYMFTDNPNLAKSKVFPEALKQAYKNIPSRNNDNAFEYRYALDKGDYKWEPYVGVGVTFVDSNTTVNLENIKGIAYDYIGSRHTLVYALASVKDYAHYQKITPGSDEWKTIIIPISELKQPSWGKPVEFSPEIIQALQWTISGKTGDTGRLCIDNIRLLRKLPKVEEVVAAEKKPNVKTESTAEIPRTVSEKVKIADWYGFCKAAYSLSFDDGLMSQYNYVAPILDKYNLKGTFYIVTENLQPDSTLSSTWHYGYWRQFIKLSKNGHELGSHSATHPKLTSLPDGNEKDEGTLQYELNAPIKALRNYLPTYKFMTFAYPFVDFNEHVMEETAKLYVSSRGHGGGFNPAHSLVWMNIQAHSLEYSPGRTLKSDIAKITTLENWISTNTIAKGGWTVYLAHDVFPFEEAIKVTDSWQPVSAESLEIFAKWLKEKQVTKELWVETVGNVTRYIKERDAVNIILKEETKDKLSFSITDNLPDDLFNYPITLEITIPKDWRKIIVKQKNSKNIVVVAGGKVQVNVVPDQGNFEIEREE